MIVTHYSCPCEHRSFDVLEVSFEQFWLLVFSEILTYVFDCEIFFEWRSLTSATRNSWLQCLRSIGHVESSNSAALLRSQERWVKSSFSISLSISFPFILISKKKFFFFFFCELLRTRKFQRNSSCSELEFVYYLTRLCEWISFWRCIRCLFRFSRWNHLITFSTIFTDVI